MVEGTKVPLRDAVKGRSREGCPERRVRQVATRVLAGRVREWVRARKSKVIVMWSRRSGGGDVRRGRGGKS